jgi:hypothetical protein
VDGDAPSIQENARAGGRSASAQTKQRDGWLGGCRRFWHVQFRASHIMFPVKARSANMLYDEGTYTTLMYSRNPVVVYVSIRRRKAVRRAGGFGGCVPQVLPVQFRASRIMIPTEASSSGKFRPGGKCATTMYPRKPGAVSRFDPTVGSANNDRGVRVGSRRAPRAAVYVAAAMAAHLQPPPPCRIRSVLHNCGTIGDVELVATKNVRTL